MSSSPDAVDCLNGAGLAPELAPAAGAVAAGAVFALPVARVFIQLKTRSLARAFDYRVPERLRQRLVPGSVVLVPFGRRKVLGVVSALEETSELPDSRLMDLEEVLEFPPVPEPLIRLSLWLAAYYYCPAASALALALPPGGLPPLVRETAADGREPVYRLKRPPVRPRRLQFVRLSQTEAAGSAAAGGVKPRGKAQARVLGALSTAGELPLAELRRRAGVSGSPIKSLAENGLVEVFTRQVRRSSLRYYAGAEARVAAAAGQAPVLNPAQAEALAAVVARLDAADPAGRSRPILLEGVPGAGKTEVYIRAIEAAVRRGGRAIVLIPEISLTHQAVKRFRRRFGERIAVYHSALSPGERYDEYMRIRDGSADVVIGPRSALFAPLPDLKIIVIDEENDSSFKQESDPRYDARRVALERARLEGAALVYGSATPSLESRHLVRDRFCLPERATGASMPAVSIVDMCQESDMIFSQALLEAIDAAMAADEKAILLLNRRGYASYLQCGQCGHVWQCGNCEVSLTIHARSRRLLCHHCGQEEPLPGVCPECGAAELRRWGIGTQRVEEELKRRFPEAPVFRLDADSAQGYGEGPRILEEFGRPGRAILLGTQMVAKGHHFPEVTLAAVLNADLTLQFPEFRAEEQTFALLVQLAGRSGRAGKPGRVLIQTWNADIECIKMAANLELDEFYGRELDRRRRLGYPPFASLINIVCLSHEEDKPGPAAEFLKGKLQAVADGEQILGPAGLFRLQGWYRSHIVVKTDDLARTLAAFGPVIEHYRGPYDTRAVRITVDVDPQRLS
ncbi:MAG: replication restart helicase PriA [Thermoleophilia bacterium]